MSNPIKLISDTDIIIGNRKLWLHRFGRNGAHWIPRVTVDTEEQIRGVKKKYHVHINPGKDLFPDGCNVALSRDVVHLLHGRGHSVTIQSKGTPIISHADIIDHDDIVGCIVENDDDIQLALRNIRKLGKKCHTFVQFGNDVSTSSMLDVIETFNGTNTYYLNELDRKKITAMKKKAAKYGRRLIIKEQSLL